jgi:hypothetical protein
VCSWKMVRATSHDDAVLVTCMRHWRALAPLHRWVTDNLQTA